LEFGSAVEVRGGGTIVFLGGEIDVGWSRTVGVPRDAPEDWLRLDQDAGDLIWKAVVDKLLDVDKHCFLSEIR